MVGGRLRCEAVAQVAWFNSPQSIAGMVFGADDVHLRWRDATTGAFVTAVLFTVGQQFIGLYLGQSSVASSYGATGSVMILLLWVYYSCQILLLGAEFTRAYAMRQGTQPAPESFAEEVTRSHQAVQV